jgi:transposase
LRLRRSCQWRALPKDLPPRRTVFDYLDSWSLDGTLDRMHHALYAECRKRGDRQASPTAAIIDSQSVKSAEKSGLASIPMVLTQASGSMAKGRVRHRADLGTDDPVLGSPGFSG